VQRLDEEPSRLISYRQQHVLPVQFDAPD
jgi:hypothetical protein